MIQFILGSAVALPLYHIFNQYLERQTNERQTNEQHTNERINYVRSGDNNVNFLSDIISRLWSNLRVAVSAKIHETIELVLDEKSLPLKLVKVDMGSMPLRFENIVFHELEKSSDQASHFKMNMDVVWNGNCDIQLEGDKVFPKFGITNITFSGRMQFVFNPLSDVLPCIGGIQIAFVDPPDINLDFTGIAAFANSNLITDIIDEALNSTLEKMMVLPNHMSIGLDKTCDYLKMYLPPLGIARITARNGWGFKVQKGTFKDDVPDVYLKISLGNRTCQTKTIKNNLSPTWDESMDFLLSSHDQKVTIEAWDEDDHALSEDDFLGSTVLTAGNFLLSSGSGYAKIPLQIDNKDCGVHVALNCQLRPLSSKLKSYQTPLSDHDKNHLGGLITVIVVRAINLPGPKEEAASRVNIIYGETKLSTKLVSYIPHNDGKKGVDPLNPHYNQTLQIPLNHDHMEFNIESPLTLELVNRKEVIGELEVSRADFISSSNTTVSETRVIGGGASLQFCVAITGFESKTLQEKASFVHSGNAGTPDINHETSQYSTVNLNSKGNNQRRQVRVTVLSGSGFEPIKKRLKTDIPDVYCKVKYGSNPKIWQTSTISNSLTPVWNEFKEYELFHHNQVLNVDVYDANKRSSDELLGNFRVTVGQVLLEGGVKEIELTMEKKLVGKFIKIQCEQSSQKSNVDPQNEANFALDINAETPDMNNETTLGLTDNVTNKETNQHHQVLVTIMSGKGFEPIEKIFKTDIPDVYCKVKYGSNPKVWQTSTINNSLTPSWNESRKYELFHPNQVLNVDVYDANKRSNDELLGSFQITVEQVLLQGGVLEIELTMEAKLIGKFIKVQCDKISSKTSLDT